MASERRRRKRKTKKARRREEVLTGPTSVHDLTDDLLELVLLRMDSPLCIVRAAFTCRLWRRIITGVDFLRRSRSLHAPPVAGHYYAIDRNYANLQPPDVDAVFVPASTTAKFDSRRLSLDFLPNNGCWELADSSGGLLLLNEARSKGCYCCQWPHFVDLIVCEPATRRFQGIVPTARLRRRLQFLGAFLLDGEADATGGRVGLSNFRVLCALRERLHDDRGIALAYMFSSGGDGNWRYVRGAAEEHDDDEVDDGITIPSPGKIHFAGRAAGSAYWGTEDGTVLVLDLSTMGFSLIEFPEHIRWSYKKSNFRIIGGGINGGTMRIVRMTGDDLEIFSQLPGSGQWVVEKSVQLYEASRGLPGRDDKYFGLPAKIVAAGEGYVLLTPQEEMWLFSVELETIELERKHERNKYAGVVYPYVLPWPPVLQAFAGNGKRKRRKKRSNSHVLNI